MSLNEREIREIGEEAAKGLIVRLRRTEAAEQEAGRLGDCNRRQSNEIATLQQEVQRWKETVRQFEELATAGTAAALSTRVVELEALIAAVKNECEERHDEECRCPLCQAVDVFR